MRRTQKQQQPDDEEEFDFEGLEDYHQQHQRTRPQPKQPPKPNIIQNEEDVESNKDEDEQVEQYLSEPD